MKRHSCIPLHGVCLPYDELIPSRKQLPPHSLSSFIYLGKVSQKITNSPTLEQARSKMIGEKCQWLLAMTKMSLHNGALELTYIYKMHIFFSNKYHKMSI